MKSNYRLNSKTLFLTYPKCPILPEDAFKILTGKVPVDKAVVGQEHHQDGDFHLHAYLALQKKVDIRDPHKLDLDTYHGKYESARDTVKVVRYCTKEGYNVFEHNIDAAALIEAREKHRRVIAREMLK